MSRAEFYYVLVFSAMALLIFVGYGRLRWQLMNKNRKSQPKFDAYERALRIQEQRDRKFGGR